MMNFKKTDGKKRLSAILTVFVSALLLITLSGCGRGIAAPDPDESAAGAVSEAPSPAEIVIGRQDGERFEDVIILEGMEETVRYEHVRNETLGFEMDYDYESFKRKSEADRECFISIYDDPEDPWNYLEITYRPEDAEALAASVSETLSKDYEIIRESYMLDHTGNCIRIDASSNRGNTGTPDFMQAVYIIPAADGSRVATAHYYFESAEGLGRRFSYMMNTLSLIPVH